MRANSTPTTPGWPEIAVGLLTFLVMLFPVALIVGFIPAENPVLQGIVGSTGGGVAGISGFAAAYFLRLRDLRAFGFHPVAGRWLLVAVCLGLVGYVLSLLIQYAYVMIGISTGDSQSILHAAARGGAVSFLLSLLGGAVLTPIGEEILFRGVIANALNRYGAWAGVGLSSVIFGLAHGVSVILPIAIMVGILSAILFRKSGSVWACIVLHGVYNGMNSFGSAFGFTPQF